MQANPNANSIKWGKVLVIGVIAVPFFFFVVLAAGVFFITGSIGKSRTASAPAEIISAEPSTWTTGSIGHTLNSKGYNVTYSFTTPAGEKFVKTDDRQTSYKDKHVCYDPKTPTDSRLTVGDCP